MRVQTIGYARSKPDSRGTWQSQLSRLNWCLSWRHLRLARLSSQSERWVTPNPARPNDRSSAIGTAIAATSHQRSISEKYKPVARRPGDVPYLSLAARTLRRKVQ